MFGNARCTIASASLAASSDVARCVTSPTTTRSNFPNLAASDSLCTRAVTRCPRTSNRRTRFHPRNPAAPVTKTCTDAAIRRAHLRLWYEPSRPARPREETPRARHVLAVLRAEALGGCEESLLLLRAIVREGDDEARRRQKCDVEEHERDAHGEENRARIRRVADPRVGPDRDELMVACDGDLDHHETSEGPARPKYEEAACDPHPEARNLEDLVERKRERKDGPVGICGRNDGEERIQLRREEEEGPRDLQCLRRAVLHAELPGRFVAPGECENRRDGRCRHDERDVPRQVAGEHATRVARPRPRTLRKDASLIAKPRA